jgi:3'-5' exonuclease
LLVNGINLPALLDIAGLKPWQVKNIDTMQYWKFGDYKNFTSLKLLAAVFNIPTPKDDISGKDVGRVYWHDNNLERIVTYCQKDVLTVAQLLLKFKGLPSLNSEQVSFIN